MQPPDPEKGAKRHTRPRSRSKVLFVMPNFAGGGAERVSLTLLNLLDREIFSPALAMLDASGPLKDLPAADVELHDLGRQRLRQALPALIRLVRQERPAVVFASQGYLNIALLAARSLMPRSTKLALRESSTPSLALPNRPRPRLMAWAYRRFYRRADLVFCQHRQTEREMAELFGVPRERIVRLPNPVDGAALRRRALPTSRHPGDGHRFVAAGRLSREKGFDRLIELFAELPGEDHLTVYGLGPEERALRALVDTLRLEGRVAIAGFTDSLPGALAGADACLVSSHWEGLPNVALESLACGTPVIATPESGGIGELAKAAAPGAIRIADWGGAFREQMAACASGPKEAPEASLLPADYSLEKVGTLFNGHLGKLAK